MNHREIPQRIAEKAAELSGLLGLTQLPNEMTSLKPDVESEMEQLSVYYDLLVCDDMDLDTFESVMDTDMSDDELAETIAACAVLRGQIADNCGVIIDVMNGDYNRMTEGV